MLDDRDRLLRLYRDRVGGEIAAIGTGYALTEDLWRQHSWGIDADGGLVETKRACDQAGYRRRMASRST